MLYRELLSFEDIKDDPYIKEFILWDINPEDLMKPRCKLTESGIEYREVIKGFIFYIDTLSKKPTVYLMKHTINDCGTTLAIINEVPQDLIVEALVENRDKEYFGMYPINSKIKDWLKKEMGMGE
ncbi:MAG: hypothetical protein N3A59_02875 [Thermodesulfovibrionales bacterium]|nr:hypothetical protein [Thermodesulfovibrionales bacterium]